MHLSKRRKYLELDCIRLSLCTGIIAGPQGTLVSLCLIAISAFLSLNLYIDPSLTSSKMPWISRVAFDLVSDKPRTLKEKHRSCHALYIRGTSILHLSLLVQKLRNMGS